MKISMAISEKPSIHSFLKNGGIFQGEFFKYRCALLKHKLRRFTGFFFKGFQRKEKVTGFFILKVCFFPISNQEMCVSSILACWSRSVLWLLSKDSISSKSMAFHKLQRAF